MSDGLHSESYPQSSVLGSRSLAGWRIVITRAAEQSDGLAERLRAAGAEPIIYPTIAFAPPEAIEPLDEALSRLADGGYDWLVLTSANAVRALAGRHGGDGNTAGRHGGDGNTVGRHGGNGNTAGRYGGDGNTVGRYGGDGNTVGRHGGDGNTVGRHGGTALLAAVGPATAAACRELLGREPSVVPETFVAEGLAAALGEMRGQRVLVLNSDLARPTLVRLLREAGASVERVVAYRTVPAAGGPDLPVLLAAGEIDAITFASGSAVRFFVERIGPDALEYARRTVIACIGPVTAEAARAAGLPPTVVAEQATEEGLVEALLSVMRSA